MYRLVYFKGVNVIGFQSGLGRKTVEIDLHDVYNEYNIISVIGANGSGKSTFISLIHPMPYPSDGRKNFIIKGKEGTLIREYISDTGVTMVSRCIYRPKGKDSDGHVASCFLKMIKPDGEETELNPNGNVTSYLSLLYNYFGINKEYINFASYTNTVASIVRMTDTERKHSIGTLVPNTKRFGVAYDIINSKYRELRTLIQNLSQKILNLRDEESLTSDLKRITEEVREYTEERENALKRLAKAEGRLKELTHDIPISELEHEYNKMLLRINTNTEEIDELKEQIFELYDQLGIEHTPDSIAYSDIDRIPSIIMKYEKKAMSSEMNAQSYKARVKDLKEKLSVCENNISEVAATAYSIQTQDINELRATKALYLHQISEMAYDKHKEEYKDLLYNELLMVSRICASIDRMVQDLYTEYGQLVTEFFGADDRSGFISTTESDITKLTARIETNSMKRDQIYRNMIEKEQYRKFQNILDQRPKSCTIDSCPFISNALHWAGVVDEITDLKKQLADVDVELERDNRDTNSLQQRMMLVSSASVLMSTITDNINLIRKYLPKVTDESVIFKAIANGSWTTVLDIIYLKELAAVLSEKELYLKIVNTLIPEVDHEISLAEAYGSNHDLLMSQLDRLKEERKMLEDELDELDMHSTISIDRYGYYTKRKDQWTTLYDAIQRIQRLMENQRDAMEQATVESKRLETINELYGKSSEQKHLIKALDEQIEMRIPTREKIKYDLDALSRLKEEKCMVESQFIIIDILRSITAPGKGIRKELIAIYLNDIYVIANQLLLDTFDGKLYLKEFLVTDDSFIIPYVYNGTESPDISMASSSQQATITSAISLAILSKLIDKYGIYTADEIDNTLNSKNKSEFIHIMASQMKYVGITQSFIITQSPEYYVPYNPLFIIFPGGEVDEKSVDCIHV